MPIYVDRNEKKKLQICFQEQKEQNANISVRKISESLVYTENQESEVTEL